MPIATRSPKIKASQRPKTGIAGMTTSDKYAKAKLTPVDRPLTELQKAFIRNYAQGESVANAMHRAGYQDQPAYGYQILKMPNAQALLARYQDEYAQASQMTKKKVIDMQMEAYEMGKLMAEPSTMVAAAREIGKLCGFYEPQKVSVTIGVNGEQRKLEQMSSEDLERLILEANQRNQEPEENGPPLLERVDGN